MKFDGINLYPTFRTHIDRTAAGQENSKLLIKAQLIFSTMPID
jgi:hypothetical protein